MNAFDVSEAVSCVGCRRFFCSQQREHFSHAAAPRQTSGVDEK
jgi:hypothetical protein